jgi:hypothetical protein
MTVSLLDRLFRHNDLVVTEGTVVIRIRATRASASVWSTSIQSPSRGDCRSAIEELAPFYGNGPLCRNDLDKVLDPGKVRGVSGVEAS